MRGSTQANVLRLSSSTVGPRFGATLGFPASSFGQFALGRAHRPLMRADAAAPRQRDGTAVNGALQTDRAKPTTMGTRRRDAELKSWDVHLARPTVPALSKVSRRCEGGPLPSALIDALRAAPRALVAFERGRGGEHPKGPQ